MEEEYEENYLYNQSIIKRVEKDRFRRRLLKVLARALISGRRTINPEESEPESDADEWFDIEILEALGDLEVEDFDMLSPQEINVIKPEKSLLECDGIEPSTSFAASVPFRYPVLIENFDIKTPIENLQHLWYQ
ncbi:uncharacterized protein LOC119671452 isoform X2 [Teleopsis dalmanni]|uniref:uncharacterized protein LOC119671452 isoform X2 n=1 Tax=Teleopsis dalmanni TaxID=139649 RepID=UPI0018CEC8F9|nr:uncharacterized protein LOC119671452 isoform X2 [Teleopsis dalmanni]